MNPAEQFKTERNNRISDYAVDTPFLQLSRQWLEMSMGRKYVYNFEWLGRPIIQYPSDMVAIQELIWKVKPDLIIETGIAHGGSLVLSASMLALLDMCDAIEKGVSIDPRRSNRKVIGIDIDIRAHNRAAIESHPLASRIQMVEGSSIASETIARVRMEAEKYHHIFVCLDSMHTHEHVMAELDAYATLVTPLSYCVVFDTFVEDMPPHFFPDRPWDVANNPKTAVRQWIMDHPEFQIDRSIESKLMVTVAPEGFLKRMC